MSGGVCPGHLQEAVDEDSEADQSWYEESHVVEPCTGRGVVRCVGFWYGLVFMLCWILV